MADETPRIDNAPYLALRHGGVTIEGWSRAGIQSYWRIPEWRVGFDLGAIPWDFTHVRDWFITHGHIDHCLALPALIARRAMLREGPPRIHVPAEIVPEVQALLAAWTAIDRGPIACHLIGMNPGDRVELGQGRFVSAFATVHPVPSRGYIVWERRSKLRDAFRELAPEELRARRDAGDVLTHEVEVPLFCYTGDTAAAGLDGEPALYDAQILLLEMTYARPEHAPERIQLYGHIHLRDVIERAERFRNELVIAAHVTSRDEPAQFQRWADERLPPALRGRFRVWGA